MNTKSGRREFLAAEALLIGRGVYHQCWMNNKTAYWFRSPEFWRLADPSRWGVFMYPRVRAIWELLMEVQGQAG
jgi:hypothetical protein